MIAWLPVLILGVLILRSTAGKDSSSAAAAATAAPKKDLVALKIGPVTVTPKGGGAATGPQSAQTKILNAGKKKAR